MHKTGVILAAAVASALCAGAVQAAPDLSDIFQVHAYGTLGVAHSSEDNADFVSSFTQQPQGTGYTKSWSPDVDSKVAVQLDGQFTDKLSAVIQLISENMANSSWTGQPNPRYRPSLEWANIKYVITDAWTIHAGRMVLPNHLLSDYRNVGYALPFIRVPDEVYGTIPTTNMDGGELSWTKHFGSVINTVSGGAGVDTIRTPSSSFQANVFVIVDTIEYDALRVHVSFMHTPYKSSTPFGTLFTGFADAAATVPGGAAAANTADYLQYRYNFNEWHNMEHYDIGAIYDPGQWFAMAEVFRLENRSDVGNQAGGFATFGYRTHELTPYATYTRLRTQLSSAPAIPLDGLPAPLAEYGAFINGAVASANAGSMSQRTLSAGLRWDFMTNLDFKVQYDYVRLNAGSSGLLVNQQPDFRLGSTTSVFSAAVDFVF